MTSPDRPHANARRRLALAITGVTIALVLSACATTANDTKSATYGVPDIMQNLTANPWTFNSGLSSPPIRSGGPISIVFSNDNNLAGVAPCHNYQGRFTLQGSDIRIMRVSRTLSRACAPQALAAETTYLAGLERVRTVKPTNRDQLELTGVNVDFVFAARISTEP